MDRLVGISRRMTVHYCCNWPPADGNGIDCDCLRVCPRKSIRGEACIDCRANAGWLRINVVALGTAMQVALMLSVSPVAEATIV